MPEDGLYLRDWGIYQNHELYLTPAAITRKMVKCFPATWQQIPERDRQLLKNYWHVTPNIICGPETKPSPAIELNSFCLPASFNACCRAGGFELLFGICFLKNATSTEIIHTIAHELGHAMSHVHNWHSHHDHDYGRECVACEMQAFSYMASWGFDPFYGLLPPKTKEQQSFIHRFYAQRPHFNWIA